MYSRVQNTRKQDSNTYIFYLEIILFKWVRAAMEFTLNTYGRKHFRDLKYITFPLNISIPCLSYNLALG